MRWQVIKIRALRWLRNILVYGAYLTLVFTLLAFLLLQLPSVQKALVNRYLGGLDKVIGFSVTFKSMHLVWYDRLSIENLVVTDPEQNTMISAKELEVNFRIGALLENNDINIDGAELDSAFVNLVKIQENDSSRDLNINVFIDRINSMSKGGGGASPKVNIGEIVLDRSKFSYNDTDLDSIKDAFDYRHFSLGLDAGDVTNFKVIGDTIQFQLNSLQALDPVTKFEVKSVRTFFRISQTSMEFLGLNLKTPNSVITDTLIFNYKSQRDFSDFNNKVNFKALLKNTVVDPADLALFAPGAERIRQPITLSGKLSGRVKRLIYNNMDVKIGNTELSGRLDLDGLPSINETFITLNLKKSKVDIHDLRFAFPEDIFERLRPLEKFNMTGTFTGFINDFVADGLIQSKLGLINSNINLKINENNIDKSLYQGSIVLKEFDLGSYFEDTVTFQHVSLNGNVKGRGLSYRTADFVLVGAINSIGIMGYDYGNITTNARFASQFFSGTLKIEDPNLKFNAVGSIDFRSGANIVQVKANLDTAVLHTIGFTKKELVVSSYVEINSKGLQIDSLFGDALFRDTKVHYDKKFIDLDSIHVISEKQGSDRRITLRSSLFDASMHGNYYYSTLFNDFNKLVHEFLLSIRNDKVALDNYYKSKRKSSQEYDAAIEVHVHDINPLTALTGIDLKLSQGLEIRGRFSNGMTSILQAFTNIDTLTYEGKQFLRNEIDFTASKIRDSANVLAMVTITSDRQVINKAMSMKNLLIEGIWNRDHVDLGVDLDQEGLDNKLRLRTEIDFLEDSTKIKVLPSKITALNKEWVVNQKNYTLFKGKEFSVHHLEIHNGEESVLVDGEVSENSNKELLLTVSNLNLNLLNNFSTEKFKGIINGTVSGRNLLHQPYIQNNIEIDELAVNDLIIGDITGVNEWNPETELFDINFTIDRFKERTMSIEGTYNPAEQVNPLDIKAKFNKASLKILESVLRGLFSQIDGSLTGAYTIRGSFSKPKLSGSGFVEDGTMMVDYLRTVYKFRGELGMSPNQIIFNEMEMTDAFNHKGVLRGYVAHKDFNKFVLNIDGEFVNFQVLNTALKDNNLFYGQGYATGNMNIFGPASNLKISATARTEKNTKIYIPVSGTSDVDKKDFVNFTHFTDTANIVTNVVEGEKKRELTGLTIDINLDITPDAYAEIIFDIKAGDIIRGRGNGDIRLQLDTKGEFNMFGGIQFTEGAYNFTLYDIINKEFTVKPGSTLTWYGDPYQGIMNITASYRQLASLAPIYDKDPDLAAEPSIKRKYPLEVQLKLDGAMLSPAIAFDIIAQDLPNNVPVESRPTPVRLAFDFNAFKARLDEQELKRQVFSLIILRKLSPLDAFSTSGSLANSVSELLSNTLSYWLTQVDQNLEIDLDLGALDTEAFNTFQLRLSYSFLNGRLRITRDGTFTNQSQQQQSVASIAGDWTVDYLLTPDGKFRVKMYSRSNFNALSSSLGAQTAVTTGVSLLHTQSFNEVKDLLRGARDKRRKQIEQQPDNIEIEPGIKTKKPLQGDGSN